MWLSRTLSIVTRHETSLNHSRTAQARDAAEDDAGRVPRSLEIELVGAALVDKCVAGDVVSVAGVVKQVNTEVASGKHDKRALSKSVRRHKASRTARKKGERFERDTESGTTLSSRGAAMSDIGLLAVPGRVVALQRDALERGAVGRDGSAKHGIRRPL